MLLVKLLPAAALALTMAACGTSRQASVQGACEGRPRADVTMFGLDKKSQDFIEESIEDNVARCGHVRPVARAHPSPPVVAQKSPVAKTKAAKERKKWRDYFRRKKEAEVS